MRLEDLACQRPFYGPLKVPAWTLGCFIRRSITFANGAEDSRTQVIWIQSHGLTGDLRIPLKNRRPIGALSLEDCFIADLARIAEAEGGVADTAWANGVMSWSNWAAFQPYDKWPEPGQLRRIGDALIEFAPSGVYVEDWRFQGGSDGLLCGLRLISEGPSLGEQSPRDGGLVIAGEHLIYAEARREGLAETCPAYRQILDATDPAAMAARVFDCTAAYARRGADGEYRIALATDPFLEGTIVDLTAFEPGGALDTLIETTATAIRFWRVDTLLADQVHALTTDASPQSLKWLRQESETLLKDATGGPRGV